MVESDKRFGRLRRIPVRELWTNEAGDFTPWLASQENISLLGDAIGVELEVEAQEKDVGPFRADILCRDTGTSELVLIENQLERTDHGHLGQLITYAAGLKAVTIVWVAARFTEEHRAHWTGSTRRLLKSSGSSPLKSKRGALATRRPHRSSTSFVNRTTGASRSPMAQSESSMRR